MTQMPKRSRLAWVCLALLVVFVAALALSPTSAKRAARVRVATMRLGSSWYVFGATLYKLMRDEFPEESRIEVMAKGGGIGNPIMVDSGLASVGLSNVCTAVWARQGDGVYDGKRYENIRALVGALNPVWITAMVREEFIRKTGKETLEEILTGPDPVRVLMKPRGSSVPVIADMIFEALGTSRDAIVQKGGRILQVSPKQFGSILRDGRADLYLETATLGHPTVTEVSLMTDVRFLDMPAKVAEALAVKGLAPAEIPEHFKGQNGPTKALNLGTLLIAHRDLDDDSAYLIARTLCERSETMARAHKAWKRFDPTRAGLKVSTGIPLHPGARRYYEEKGWLDGMNAGGKR